MGAKALMLPKNSDIDWSHFEKSLHDRFGVNVFTLKKNGVRKTSGDVRWANDLCTLIKTDPNGASRICDRVLKYLLNETKIKRTATTNECAAGMNKIVLPIIQNDEINEFINICGRPL